ncbi:MAG TPA: LL-diaminopimelate aminotransferase [Pseudogracilibacillus sp.]|nr:LL-diaminopimelate aminotransferase [Pseudogracilibacillus sp.]
MGFTSQKIKDIPPYIFSEINKKKAELKNKGVDVIDLGIGDPDLSTPQPIIDELIKEMGDQQNFKYSNYSGCIEFREAVASYYKKQYDVDLDPETEILTLIGSKEGIANLVPTVVNPGEYVLVPDPSYGVYRMAAHLADAQTYSMPITEENNFTPELEKLPDDIKKQASLMFLNYPSNPTAAMGDLDFFNKAVTFGKENSIPIAHDFAYNTVSFNDPAPSMMQAEGAKDIAVEFGSLSKSYNMTGWRIGYVVGNKEIIKGLSVIKSNTDTSQFLPVQKAAAFALNMDQSVVTENVEIYRERMNAFVEGLSKLGLDVTPPDGSFFVWFPVPKGYTSGTFASEVLEKCGVVVTPGSAFGTSGEGYARVSLTHSVERLQEVIDRLKKVL